jgi:hypothetical protein
MNEAEIATLPVWLSGWAGIAVVMTRMVMTKRFLAAGAAFVLAGLAYVPLTSVSGYDMYPLLQFEISLTLYFALPALIYARRYAVLGVFLAASLAHIPVLLLMLKGDALGLLTTPMHLLFFSLLCAPVFVALAAVFCIGAFVERRTYRTACH